MARASSADLSLRLPELPAYTPRAPALTAPAPGYPPIATGMLEVIRHQPNPTAELARLYERLAFDALDGKPVGGTDAASFLAASDRLFRTLGESAEYHHRSRVAQGLEDRGQTAAAARYRAW